MLQTVNIGFGSLVSCERILVITTSESSPVKKFIAQAREQNKVIDATRGRRTRSVIILDSDHIVLSPLQPITISERMQRGDKINSPQD